MREMQTRSMLHASEAERCERPDNVPALRLSKPVSLRPVQRSSGKKFYYCWPFLLTALRLADLCALLGSGFLAHYIRFGSFQPRQNAELFLYFSSVASLVALDLSRAYRVKTVSTLDSQLSNLFLGGLGALSISLACGFLSHTLGEFSRVWIVLTVLIGAVALCGNRIGFMMFLRGATARGEFRDNVVLVGANARAEKMISALQKDPAQRVRLLGLFEDRVHRPLPELHGVPLLGSVDDLIEYIRLHQVDRVVVTLPWVTSERIESLLQKLRTVPVRIDLVPNDMIWHFGEIRMERLGGVPILTIVNAKVDAQGGFRKRIADLVLALTMLTCLAPVMLAIALAIKLDTKGPVLFRQKRHGFNNGIFDVFKFRSMHLHTCAAGAVAQATRSDARITRTGQFLRRSSLDELPQLFNVILGNMSIVGPRPHAVEHNLQYASIITAYYARHNVKPGITGWAQVNGLRGETDTADKMQRRVAFDLYYIERWSLLFDLKIILMTAVTVWFQEGAY